MYQSSPVQTTARTYVLIVTIAGKLTQLLGKCITPVNKRVSDCMHVKTIERMTLYAVMEDWMIAYVNCRGFHAKIINETHLKDIKDSDKVAKEMKQWIQAICNGVPTNKDRAALKGALSMITSTNSKNTTTKLVKETLGGGRFQQTSTVQEPSLLEIIMMNQARILNEMTHNYERLKDTEGGIPHNNERYKTDKKTKALQIKQENGEYREPKQPKDLLPDTQINGDTGIGYIQLKDAVKVFNKRNKLNEFKAPSIFATVTDIVTGDAQQDGQGNDSEEGQGEGNGEGEAGGNDEDKNNKERKKRNATAQQADFNGNESESEDSDEDDKKSDDDYTDDEDEPTEKDDDDDKELDNEEIYQPESDALDNTNEGVGKTLEDKARTVCETICETIRTELGNYKNNIDSKDKEDLERLKKDMDSTTSRLEKRVKEIMLLLHWRNDREQDECSSIINPCNPLGIKDLR